MPRRSGKAVRIGDCLQADRGDRNDEIEIAAGDFLRNRVTGTDVALRVITAQRNAIDAELNMIRTKKNVEFALINLYRSTGGGWE